MSTGTGLESSASSSASIGMGFESSPSSAVSGASSQNLVVESAEVIVGILGSVVGGWLGNLIGVGGGAGFTKIGFVTSIVGACLLLIVFSRIGKNK